MAVCEGLVDYSFPFVYRQGNKMATTTCRIPRSLRGELDVSQIISGKVNIHGNLEVVTPRDCYYGLSTRYSTERKKENRVPWILQDSNRFRPCLCVAI